MRAESSFIGKALFNLQNGEAENAISGLKSLTLLINIQHSAYHTNSYPRDKIRDFVRRATDHSNTVGLLDTLVISVDSDREWLEKNVRTLRIVEMLEDPSSAETFYGGVEDYVAYSPNGMTYMDEDDMGGAWATTANIETTDFDTAYDDADDEEFEDDLDQLDFYAHAF